MDKHFVGKKVIVRGCSSGVFYGTLEKKTGQEVIESIEGIGEWKMTDDLHNR